jgi:hypothetical protein
METRGIFRKLDIIYDLSSLDDKSKSPSVLATGPKVRGFDPDRGRWIFKGDKNPEHHFLRRGSKDVGPMS